METYVLDTNLFFNMEANMGIGNDTETIIRNMTTIIKNSKDNLKFIMPPRIVEEIKSFFDNPEQEFLKDFFAEITVKSPNLGELMINAHVIAEYIEESRKRAYRSQDVAEEEIKQAGTMFMGKEALPQKEFQMAIGKIIKNFRSRYRNALRTGFIDSLADFDLIMLAKEQNATLVSTDEGVIQWGRKLGVKEIAPSVLGKKMQAYL
ncbi:MAG TPA: RNA ligase partner protein [Candidatus Woesebacteria bacterium]|nr:RNA ligase partner protein [Candidatus Woesebacteria bacterium]